MAVTEQIVDITTPDGPMATPTYRPEGEGPRPAVIVIMEAFGVNANIMGIAKRYAEQGYVGVAPDLFHRAGRLQAAPYDKLMEYRDQLRVGFSDDSVMTDLGALMDSLRADPGVSDSIGIVGFCLGGRISYMAAANLPGITASAVYYGGFMVPSEASRADDYDALPDAPKVKVPMLGFFGEEDTNPSPEQVAKLDAALKAAGASYEFHSYAGAGHGFFCDDRGSYNPGAAADTWTRVQAFFKQHLGD